MSDDLVQRLRDLGDHASFEPHMHHIAADRIEELEAKRDEAVNQLDSARHSVDVLEKRCRTMIAEREAAEAKLAKAVGIAMDAIETMESGPFFPEKEGQRLLDDIAELKGSNNA